MSAIFEQFVDQLTLSKEQLLEDYSIQLKEWKKNLKALYQDVESYLKPYLDSGKITIRYEDTQIAEEELGLYTVKSAIITIGSQSIRLDPIGTFLIAAKGRVDMIGPRDTVRLVLVDKDLRGPRIKIFTTVGDGKPPVSPKVKRKWAWKISTAPPDIQYFDLNETVFQDAMMSVVNV